MPIPKTSARTIKVVSDTILEWNPSVGVESAMELTFSILNALERSQKEELREIIRERLKELSVTCDQENVRD